MIFLSKNVCCIVFEMMILCREHVVNSDNSGVLISFHIFATLSLCLALHLNSHLLIDYMVMALLDLCNWFLKISVV
jgi:hypothetical protein